MAFSSHRDSNLPDPRRIAAEEQSIDWLAIETLVHRDPAGRGLASFNRGQAPLDAGQLRASATHLARHATRVGIVTGFPVIADGRVVAETDGPPGALFLARALVALGIDVAIVTDTFALPLIEVGCDLWNLDRRMVVEFPLAGGPAFADKFLAARSHAPWSHMIAIERPGPSHTLESLAAQTRIGPVPRERFLAEVAPEDRDACHNMRGQSIDAYIAKTHHLFERIGARNPATTTIGIGDGGNEIGMGRFPWEQIVEAIGDRSAGRIACRIATDFTLTAGVSNWAAYALALAVTRLRAAEASELGRDWHAAGQRRLIEAIVCQTSAVDGVTLRREPTVDGLELDAYLVPLVEIRKRLSYPEPAAD